MKRTKLTLLIIVALAFSAFPLALFSIVSAKVTTPLPKPYDIGPELRSKDIDPSSIYISDFPVESNVPTTAATAGDFMYIINQNMVTGGWYLETYYCRAVSDIVEVWVSDHLDWLPDDPREETYPIVITDDMIQHLVDEFELPNDRNNGIHTTDTAYYGQEDFHDGSDAQAPDIWSFIPQDMYYDEAGRNMILITNFRDDNYYDPSYPSFVIGFYWSLFEDWYGRNIINLDAAYWAYLLGPAGSNWYDDVIVSEANQLAYESTVAHEYQHLIHDDYLPGDETYMNEACSLFAEQLCGYPIDTDKIDWFLATPDNSLTEWGDQGGINILADYGAAYLWALYLTDHYGYDFMGRYTQGTNKFGVPIPDLSLPSIPRITALLPRNKDFYDVYHDWIIANLIHSDSPGCGRYNYKSIDLDDYYLNIHTQYGDCVHFTGSGLGETGTIPYGDPPTPYMLGVWDLAPFSTDYVSLPDLEGFTTFIFDGDDTTNYFPAWQKFEFTDEDPEGMEVLDGSWWSGPEYALKNVLLAGKIYISATNPVLNLLTYWDIEDNYYPGSPGWDFGFVQVSTNGGKTWTSLSNDFTSDLYDPHCYTKIRDNLPGLTGWTPYYTGEYYTPIDMSFDLSAFIGKHILIGFRFMSDWGTEYDGWFIKEADVNGHSVMNALAPVPKEADFLVTLVEKMTCGRGRVNYKVTDMWFKYDPCEIGIKLAHLNKNENAFLIISSISEYGTVDYEVWAKSFRFGCGCRH